MLESRSWIGTTDLFNQAGTRYVFDVGAAATIEFWFAQRRGVLPAFAVEAMGLGFRTTSHLIDLGPYFLLNFIDMSINFNDMGPNSTGAAIPALVDTVGWRYLTLTETRPGFLRSYLDNVLQTSAALVAGPVMGSMRFALEGTGGGWTGESPPWFIGPIAAHSVELTAAQRLDSFTNRRVQALGGSTYFSYNWVVEGGEEAISVRSQFTSAAIDILAAISGIETSLRGPYQTYRRVTATPNVESRVRVRDDNSAGGRPHYLNFLANFDGFGPEKWAEP